MISASCGMDHMLWSFTMWIIFLSLHLTTNAGGCINVYGCYITREGPVFGWMDYHPENDEDTWIKGDIWRGLTIYKNLEIALFNESLEDEIVCNSVNWIQVTMIILFLVQ